MLQEGRPAVHAPTGTKGKVHLAVPNTRPEDRFHTPALLLVELEKGTMTYWDPEAVYFLDIKPKKTESLDIKEGS